MASRSSSPTSSRPTRPIREVFSRPRVWPTRSGTTSSASRTTLISRVTSTPWRSSRRSLRRHPVRVFGAVTNLPLRPPAVLAKAAATLDLLSGGRFETGVGAGGYLEAAHAMGAPALTPAESLAALEEASPSCARCGAPGPRTSIRRRPLPARGCPPRPRSSTSDPDLDRFQPPTLALTGRVGDSWVAPLMNYKPPREAAEANRVIDQAARDAGRDPRDIRRIYNIPGAITATSQARATDSDQTIVGPRALGGRSDALRHRPRLQHLHARRPARPAGTHGVHPGRGPLVRERVAERRASSPQRTTT